MRAKIAKNVVTLDGKQLPINTLGEGKGCYLEILQTIDNQLMAMLTHHSKVLMVRVDIHLQPNEYPSDNHIMSHYIKKLRKWAEKKYKISRLGFVWCRELCKSKKLHYHVMILIDGNKVQDHRTILAKSKRLAASYEHLGYGSVPILADCFHMIHRGDKLAYNTAFRHASYLAKERTKDNHHLSDKGKNYSSSRIKPSSRVLKSTIFSAKDKMMIEYDLAPKRKPQAKKQPVKPPLSATEYKDLIAAKLKEKPVHLMTDAERQLPLF